MKVGAVCVPCTRGTRLLLTWGTRGFVTTVSNIHSGIAGCSCAEMISPSWFVGLLEQPALSPGESGECSVLNRHKGQCCRVRQDGAPGTGPGLGSARRHGGDVLPSHMMEGFFCGCLPPHLLLFPQESRNVF